MMMLDAKTAQMDDILIFVIAKVVFNVLVGIMVRPLTKSNAKNAYVANMVIKKNL